MTKASPETSPTTKPHVDAQTPATRTDLRTVMEPVFEALRDLSAQLDEILATLREWDERRARIQARLEEEARVVAARKKADGRLSKLWGALAHNYQRDHDEALASLSAEFKALEEAYRVPHSPEVAAFEARLARLEEAVGVSRG